MSDTRDDDLLRSIWMEQNMQTHTPDIDTLRRYERRLEASATWRNRIEFIAGGLVAAFLLFAGFSTLARAETLGSHVTGFGHLSVAAGTLWVILRLHRLTRNARGATAGAPILAHLRQRIVAERDMLRGAWRWYVAPLVPGFVLIYGGAALEPEPNWTVFWTGTLLTTAILAGIAWLNHRAAVRAEREIVRLDEELDT